VAFGSQLWQTQGAKDQYLWRSDEYVDYSAGRTVNK
jgi:hypothetical protein